MNKIFTLLFPCVITVVAHARPEVIKTATCYEVTAQGIKGAKATCTVTETGGAGVSVLTYKFKGKDYAIVDDDKGSSLNNETYEGYARNRTFKRIHSNTGKAYYCYKSASVHFCTSQ